MPSDRASQTTIRRRRLAAELRRLRERAGLTGDQAAAELGWSGSKISRIETYRIGVKTADLKRMLDRYGVDPSYRKELEAFARESSRAGQLEPAVAGLPSNYAQYLYAENEAQAIWNWDSQVVPGLLQTEDYARALHLAYQSLFRLPPGETERRIELQRMRQDTLTRKPALELSVIIDESILYRRFADQAVMRGQLLRLTELSSLPNVGIQVLALNGEHFAHTGAFSYMKFPQLHDIPLNDMVTVEHLTGSFYLEDEEQTYPYRLILDWLTSNSLSEEQSRDLITGVVRDRWA
jgi:transcriptional regulator with XRE-family HTH domain